ncbi:synaptotagmin-5 isoform X1 [Macrosteles quadrilineatus]|uniref:synaptotagmin-5 isoform X1 n=1 Tax=Macrosteles quadrilineatus TaxID=74068 RepID=UPI0023E26E7D|nr:synaptotagmin-5 isoform X1 [Macrosteles quadrilineatus]
MTSSAVLGAATGTGLALLVAMTIVVYRYYSSRRWGKEWNYKGSWTAGPATYYYRKQQQQQQPYVTTQKVFNVAKEQHVVQPVATVAAHAVNTELLHSPLEVSPGAVLTHQSRSYPGVQGHLSRTPSVSSQSSLDSSISKQSHRGSSPQIRTFAPDGRGVLSRVATTTEREPPPRSPSPHRSPSFDSRAPPSPAGDIRTPSPSQSSLVSVCSSPVPQSPRARCLSPLLLPPRNQSQEQQQPPASPLGTLQPDLYQKREGPLFLQGQRGSPSLGRLHLRLKYDFDRSDLHVHLIEAHDLAGSGQGGFNDPYVKLTMSPEVDSRKRQTVIHRNDPNPFFDQHFKFPVSHEDLKDKTLILQVFDYDRFSRNDVVGEVRVNMLDLDVTSSVEVWGDITKHKKPPEELQEVLLSLSYLPSAERLTVVLLKARNLFRPQNKDTIDPFVKVYLLSSGKRVKKKKTATRKATTNPVWNEALTFNISSANLALSAIEVCVMDGGSDLIGNSPLLGCCVIGPHEEGPGQDHWTDMTQSPRKAVAMWHTLR